MVFIKEQFIYVQINDTVGELIMNFGHNVEKNGDSFGFKVDTKSPSAGKTEQTLIPGKFVNKELFEEIPLKIHYVQIISIQQIIEDRLYEGKPISGFLKASLRIFNMDSETFKDLNLSIVAQGGYSLSFMNLAPLINFINKYIIKNKNVDNLNIEKLIDNSFRYKPRFEIHLLIKKIKIDLFEDSQYRVGKDNYYWIEAILTNLDSNIYFRAQLTNFFDRIYEGCRIEDDNIVATIESEYGCVVSGKRSALENKDLVEEIKIKLALWLGKHFVYDEYQFNEFEFNPC